MLARLVTHTKIQAAPERPVLHLSGPRLRAALEGLIRAVEPAGGIERYAQAIGLKSAYYKQMLGEGRVAELTLADFELLVLTMATVRRRIAKPIEAMGWSAVHEAIVALLKGAEETTTADQRIKAFCAAFPAGKEFRFVRDLASELLHNVHPELYPLMNRWVWDTKANTGVIREIWHGDNVDHMVIDMPDGYETFLMLREELSQFLTENGVFRDVIWYTDLIQAHVYGEYIGAQGGAYLKTDFSAEIDPLEHSRRILGLDDVAVKAGRSRLKTIDGTAQPSDNIKRLN